MEGKVYAMVAKFMSYNVRSKLVRSKNKPKELQLLILASLRALQMNVSQNFQNCDERYI